MNVEWLAGQLFPAASVAAVIVAGLTLCTLAAGAVGMGVWRGAFADLLRRQPPRSTKLLGVGLGVGLVAGMNASIASLAFRRAGANALGYGLSPMDLTFDAVLVAGVMLLLAWVRMGAVTWLQDLSKPDVPRLGLGLGLGLAGLFLAVWLSGLLLTSEFGTVGLQMLRDAMRQASLPSEGWVFWASVVVVAVSLLGGNPLTTLVIACGWAYLLAARWRRRGAAGTRWTSSVAVGVLAWLGFLLTSAIVFEAGARLNAVTGSLLFVVIGDGAPFLVALAAHATAGIVAFLRASSTRAAHALLAAFVAGLLAAISFLPVLGALGGFRTPGVLMADLSAIVNVGALCTLACIWVVGRLAPGRGGRRPGLPWYSDDGRWWWDGQRWVAVAWPHYSPDGRWWWNGQRWRALAESGGELESKPHPPGSR